MASRVVLRGLDATARASSASSRARFGETTEANALEVIDRGAIARATTTRRRREDSFQWVGRYERRRRRTTGEMNAAPSR
jgi:hypothetical protein